MQTDSPLTLTETKHWVDEALRDYSAQRIRDAKRIGPSYVRLHETIDTLVQIGGKRLRPYIVLSTFHAYAPNEPLDNVLPAATAQELLHLAMLVHDDIIDRDLVRYGIPNVAGSYEAYYQRFINDSGEQKHLALSAALLAGDALLADAHQIIRRTQAPKDRVERAEEMLSHSIFDVIGGELLDTEVAVLPSGSVDPLSIAEHKTSSYSFVGPLSTGAVLAGAPEEDVALLGALGKHLGISYQLVDDLLGMFGDEHTTGKSTSTDIVEGKRTFLVQEFERIATEAQKSDFFSVFHRSDAGEDEIIHAKALLSASGAVEAVNERIRLHRAQCLSIIDKLQIDDTSKELLASLIAICLDREK